jgi:putative ABC transport system permease protein
MLKNYFKIAFRNLFKYKGFSFINIFGLSIGITCCILILLFVKDELSYDKFNEKAERIYKVHLDFELNKTKTTQPLSCAPLAETMLREFPEVESAVRVSNTGTSVLRYKDKVFNEDLLFQTDSTIFNIFTISMVQGDSRTALTKPFSIVLTESMAKKYFTNEEPLGKLINIDNAQDYTVTGIVKDCPQNTHWHYNFLVSLSSSNESRRAVWINNNYHTYLLLREGSSWKNLGDKMNGTLENYFIPDICKTMGTTVDELKKSGIRANYFLLPMIDIHLHSNYTYDFEKNGNMAYVYIFSVIGFAILCIACINFMNLSTARAQTRAKEIGVRKTIGSTYKQILTQFLVESIILSTIALILSLMFIDLLLPLLNDISGKNIHINFIGYLQLLPVIPVFIIIISLAAGAYPAFFLASLKPLAVLGGRLKLSNKGKAVRSGLVIFQFSISIILLIGTFIVQNQLKYIQNKNLGYNKEQVLIIHKIKELGKPATAFKEELLKYPGIISVSNSTAIPGSKDYEINTHRINGESDDNSRLLMAFKTDCDFLNSYQIKIKQGEFFSKDKVIDNDNSVVINESASRSFGLTDPIGKEFVIPGYPQKSLRIIGVISDYNFETLHSEIRPMIAYYLQPYQYGNYFSVRIRPDNFRNTFDYIKTAWNKFANNQPFEYSFHDEDFAKQYRSEQQTGKLFGIFSGLGILVACLGLFGLVTHTVERRTKEIGIRKVLGSTMNSIVFLLSKDFTKLVLFSNLIAWPVGYFLMNKWLQNFAFRTDIGIWVFFLSGIISIFIAFITICFQSIKSARANPVESLKYE